MSGRALPPSVSGAAVAGFIGGAITWALASSASALPSAIRGYGRLDQVMSLLLGASVGACVLTLRARHRREPMAIASLIGAIVGGVAAATGASIGLLLSGSPSPVGFVLERVATWALMCASTAVSIAMCTRTRRTVVAAESAVIGAFGGILAGAMMSLPGPTELWWPLALTVAGAVIGFAAVGPGVWRAPVVVQLLPQREHRLTLWSLHECAIERGWSMPIAEAQVGCVDGTVYVYPPPAGAVLDGYPLYRALPLTRDAILGVGRIRARLAVRTAVVRANA